MCLLACNKSTPCYTGQSRGGKTPLYDVFLHQAKDVAVCRKCAENRDTFVEVGKSSTRPAGFAHAECVEMLRQARIRKRLVSQICLVLATARQRHCMSFILDIAKVTLSFVGPMLQVRGARREPSGHAGLELSSNGGDAASILRAIGKHGRIDDGIAKLLGDVEGLRNSAAAKRKVEAGTLPARLFFL